MFFAADFSNEDVVVLGIEHTFLPEPDAAGRMHGLTRYAIGLPRCRSSF